MRIGTTPTHSFTLKDGQGNPYNFSNAEEVQVTYTQENTVLLQKHLDDMTVSGNTVSFTLTQAETFLFRNGICRVQLRVVDTSGKVFGTEVQLVVVKECLDTNVLPIDEDEEEADE